MTKLSVHFIGTGSGAPSLDRGSPSIMIRREGVGVVFDCGEATQLAMRRHKARFRRLEAIFVSHMHGDHVLGLPGLLMTLNLNAKPQAISVYGPEGISHYLGCVFEATGFQPKFELKVVELSGTPTPKLIHRATGFSVYYVSSQHVVPSFAFAFVEDDRPGEFKVDRALELGVPRGPLWGELQRGRSVEVNGRIVKPEDVLGEKRRGRRVVYSGDTRPCEAVLRLGLGADVFIHEATFPDEYREEAVAGGHSTISEAVGVLEKSGCNLGVLTNIGQRTKAEDLDKVVHGVRPIIVASDGLTLDVPLP